jgi:DNA-binding NarL/FixJ family response regulator
VERAAPAGKPDAARATTEPHANEGEVVAGSRLSPLPVLLVTANAAFAERLRRGLGGSAEIALTVRSAPTSKTPLSYLAAQTGARLIVVDSDLFANGIVGLSFPADPEGSGPEVLLLFDKVTEAAVRLSLLSRAHGCLQADVSTGDFVHAVDAVVHGGELWFPRWMMEPFYDMALAAMASAADPAKQEADSALTERESEVIRLVQRGMTNKQAAERLRISPNTVKKHLHNALVKRGIQRRRQLFR